METTTTSVWEAANNGSGQYLAFLLGAEEYGLELLKIQEIRGYTAVTPIPHAPPYMKGVMNLRGTVIPVFDLRSKFGMPETEYSKFTVIIVAAVAGKIVGLVVDAVSDVLNIAASDLRAAPDMNGAAQFIDGIANVSGRLAVLLNIEKLLAGDALTVSAAEL